MHTMHDTTGGDAVTITEALKRLGNQAPARPTFTQAVNREKILKLTDKTTPDGRTMVSWASVLEYVASGGFKARPKSVVTTDIEIETRPATETVSPDTPGARVLEVAVAPKSARSEPPNIIIHGTNGGNRAVQPPPAKDHPSLKSGGRRKPTQPREHSSPRVKAASEGGANSKVHRNPPLRAIKNNLRHLNFEESKNIRDWMDNRLLTVLRPTVLVIDSNKESQPI